MLTGNKNQKLTKTKTKSIIINQQLDKKIPLKVASKSKQKDKKTIDTFKTNQNKIKDLMIKTLKFLNKKTEITYSSDLLEIAESVYKLTKQNHEKKKQNIYQTQRSLLENNSSCLLLQNKLKQSNENVNKSNILHYFKQKFDNSLCDEKSIEKKLKAFQFLKKPQDITLKYQSRSIQSPDIDDKDKPNKHLIIDKINSKIRV